MDNLAEKKKRLQSTINSINKRFGVGTVSTAAQAALDGKLTKKVIATPSLVLNEALYGGFCGIVELYGPQSSGKTSLVIETIATEQERNPEFIAAWMETEGSVTEDILASHGVDMDRLIYWRQEDVLNAENALDIARGFIVSGDIDFLAVNSVAGLAPKTETEEDLDKQNIALLARLMSKFFRVANGSISKNNITVVFINQIRDNVGVMFGNPETTTGGKALEFYASQRLHLNKVKNDIINDEEGVKINVITTKNRFAGTNNPYTKCSYYARYNGGIDNIITMPTMLLKAGIVRQAGAYWYYEDKNGNLLTYANGPCKWKSRNDFLEAIRNDIDLYARFQLALKGQNNNTPELLSEEEIENIKQEEEKNQKEMAALLQEE